ncbi:MAG: hypothetical protein PHU14_14265 [Methylovulum sp.]|nr:hypothetical protein [Methylovulum sp.]
MKNYLVIISALSVLYGCTTTTVKPTPQACAGTAALPLSLASDFESVEDTVLLTKAIGTENKGALCRGQVYRSKTTSQIMLFRAWNSTNPNSKFGNWWTFNKPTGKVADYRKDYGICYQWTPLDMLVQCTLKPSVKVVVGAGQSVQCSQCLTYPVSATQQLFIENSESALSNCTTFSGVLSWQ